MRAVVKFTIVAAIVIAVAWFVSGLTGTVSMRVADTVFETSVPVALLLLAVLFLILYALFRIVAGLVRLPRAGRRQRERSSRRRGDDAVTRTLVALAAGDGGRARQEAARGRNYLGDTPLTLLLAAQSARQAGQENEAADLFRKLAAPAGPDRLNTAFLGLRGLMRQAIARQDWDEAAKIAAQAERVQPGASWLREERAMLAVRTGQWREAIGLGAGSAAVAVAAAEQEPNLSRARKLAQQAWESEPTLTPAAIAYARRLRQSGKEWAAKDVLRRAWAQNPHPDLAAFALDAAGDPGGRLRAAQDLTRLRPDNPDSHLLLGRASLEAGQLTEARRYADAAAERGLTQRRLHVLRADIAEKAGDPAAERAAHRDESMAEPDPVWRCEACGAVHPSWHASCPACGATGQIVWGSARGSPAVRQLARPASDGVEVLM